MRNKVVVILLLMFLSATIISCCNCEDPVTYEKVYNAVEITPYNISGFTPMVATEPVSRNAFGLIINIKFETKMIAHKVGLNLGFSSAMALEPCDCVGDIYRYPDPITNLKIYVMDQPNGEKLDVTDSFFIYSYANKKVSLNGFLKERDDSRDRFQLELEEDDSIPNSAIFMVEMFLESGKSYTKQSDVVNFIKD